MPEIISRSDAKAKGLKRYFTGKPCKHGHVAERYVLANSCVECMYAAVAANAKANPEGILKQKRARMAANPEKVKEENRRWRARNSERYQAKLRLWKEKNRETMLANQRAAYEANREIVLANKRAARAANIEKYREQGRRAYDKRVCRKASALVDRGLDHAKASGIFLDIDTAIDLFKSQHNTFDFMDDA